MDEGARPGSFLLGVVEDRVALGGVLGAIGVVVGSTLPWAIVPTVVGTVTESGLEANGKLTLVVGLVALAFVVAALRLPGADLPVAGAIAGAAAAGIAVAYLFDVRASSARVLARLLEGRGTLDPSAIGTRFLARPGVGVWVVLASGAAVAGSSLALLVRMRRER